MRLYTTTACDHMHKSEAAAIRCAGKAAGKTVAILSRPSGGWRFEPMSRDDAQIVERNQKRDERDHGIRY